MLTRNHLHYQHPKPAIINREGIITYLFILKIAKRAILKKKNKHATVQTEVAIHMTSLLGHSRQMSQHRDSDFYI